MILRIDSHAAPEADFKCYSTATALCLLFLLLLTAGCERSSHPLSVERGQLFPAMLLKGLNRPDISLDAYRGKTILLNVWAPWCGPCIAEMPQLEKLTGELNPSRFAVLGLTVDDRFLADEFLNNNQITFPNYFDADRSQVQGVLRINNFPQTFVIGPTGNLIARIIGYQEWNDPKVIAVLRDYHQADLESMDILAREGGAYD